MIKNLTRRPLWLNILVGIGLAALVLILFIFSLRWITKHGEAKTVPFVTGKNIKDVESLLDDKGFKMIIQDSVYYDSLPPGVVVKQFPEADQVVKVNRTVYVVINRFIAPYILMPNLVGFSYRNAELTMHNVGLKIGDTSYRPDFAKNSILEMSFDGKTIKPGDKIKVGSTIDLVLGSGIGSEDMPVPKLIGLTLGEAKVLLDQYGLVLNPLPNREVKDLENAYIFNQSPMPKTPEGNSIRIRAGQMIDVFLQTDPIIDSTNENQLPQLPQQ